VNYDILFSKNEFYRIGNIPVRVYLSRYGKKAFSYQDGGQKRIPMDLIWKKGLRINEDEFLILSSVMNSNIKRAS
jgi:hypothetical protein